MENNKNVGIIRAGSHALMKRAEELEMVFSPDTDIYETADAFIVKLDMPGATRDSLSLTVDSKQLLVRGEVLAQSKDQGKILYSEIWKKKYFREFNLGSGIQREKIDAQFESGVLTVTLPKSDEIKSREIHIQ